MRHKDKKRRNFRVGSHLFAAQPTDNSLHLRARHGCHWSVSHKDCIAGDVSSGTAGQCPLDHHGVGINKAHQGEAGAAGNYRSATKQTKFILHTRWQVFNNNRQKEEEKDRTI
jgi:hypothetical protein